MQDDPKLPIDEEDLEEAASVTVSMELAESHDGICEVDADAELTIEEVDGHTTPTVRLIRAGLNKSGTREYTPTFLKQCIAEGRFTNSLSFLNHPTPDEKRQRPERDMRYLAAHTGEAFWDDKEQAVKAPLVFIAENHPMSMGSLAKQQFANPVVRKRAGLSIYYTGPVEMKEVMRTVKGGQQRKVAVPVRLVDEKPFDVDIVTAPGAGGGFDLLEANRDSQEAEAMDLSELTLEQLKESRPDLVAALVEASRPVEPTPPAPTTPSQHEGPQADPKTDGDLRETIAEIVRETVADALAPLQAKLAEADRNDWFSQKLADCNLSEKHEEHLRRAFDGRVFETREAFDAAFDGEIGHLRELLESSRDRVATLGAGTTSDAADTQKTLAEIVGLTGGEK